MLHRCVLLSYEDPESSLAAGISLSECIPAAAVPAAQAAIKACASGGCIVLVGMGQEEMKLPVVEASIREVDIMGSFRYCNTVSGCSVGNLPVGTTAWGSLRKCYRVSEGGTMVWGASATVPR